MSAASSELLRLPLCCDPLAPGHARDAVECLDALQPVRADAVLLVSELVSTAVIATGATGTERADESLELIASQVPDGVQLTVAADGQHDEPRPAPLVARVIEKLSRRWGTEHCDGKARVWAELAL